MITVNFKQSAGLALIALGSLALGPIIRGLGAGIRRRLSSYGPDRTINSRSTTTPLVACKYNKDVEAVVC